MKSMRGKTYGRQGELRFVRMPASFQMPASARALPREGGKLIVGHSETGHHHVMEGLDTELYQLMGLSRDGLSDRFMVVKDPDVLLHERDAHRHDKLEFDPGVYRIVVGREYVPGAGKLGRERQAEAQWRRSAD